VLPTFDNVHPQLLRILTNSGTGSSWFNDPVTVDAGGNQHVDMIATDLNGDGLPDLIVLDKNGYVQVLMNKTQVVNLPIAIDLAPGQESSANDFANGQVAPIYGTVFEDTNGNGSPDVGEPGLGATVFLDANNNGVLDPGELSTTTDANGTYAFPNVPDG